MASASRDLLTLGNIVESAAEPAPAALRARVQRVVAAHARDRDDCRLLLEALGLSEALPEPAPEPAPEPTPEPTLPL
ncbi:hypothetical protein [Kitasatospora sp. McL0602]|uniref:hypothetical protein n=1 Tax=Kitasatospora sp. McL0602 TaxID=3439530 RepID=UPI003F8A0A6C